MRGGGGRENTDCRPPSQWALGRWYCRSPRPPPPPGVYEKLMRAAAHTHPDHQYEQIQEPWGEGVSLPAEKTTEATSVSQRLACLERQPAAGGWEERDANRGRKRQTGRLPPQLRTQATRMTSAPGAAEQGAAHTGTPGLLGASFGGRLASTRGARG